MKTSQCLSLCLRSARRCQEGLLHGLQRREAGVHEGGQQQGRGVSGGRPAEEASREGGQVQTGQSEGENAARCGSCLWEHRCAKVPEIELKADDLLEGVSD